MFPCSRVTSWTHERWFAVFGCGPLQVPSEVFRLGRTRVFFRAGQISTLQKILNETGPEKSPWIFERLQQALANRHKAKAAAEEAKVHLKLSHHDVTNFC